jgi:hypothetical protein
MTMIRGLRVALGYVSLLGLGVWACSSASAADADGRPRSKAARNIPITSARNTPPAAPVDAPPAASSEPLGSAALEHRLDQLEREINGAQP